MKSMPHLDLHLDPESLTEMKRSLLKIGASAQATSDIIDVYKKYAQMLADQYKLAWSSLNDKCQTPLHNNKRQATSSAFKDRYTRLLSQWREESLKSISARYNDYENKVSQRPKVKRRVEFNKDFIPQLENFYNTNQFPSRLEKITLAQKSCMSYKQIEIWFQNRRNRRGKIAKYLPEPTTTFNLPSNEHEKIKALKSTSSGRLQHRSSGRSTHHKEFENELLSISGVSSFHSSRPAYAFPATHPLSLENDLLLREANSGSLVFSWPRTPSKRLKTHSAMDVSSLCKALESLTINDDSGDVATAKVANLRYTVEDRFNPMIVRPHPAPLPFLDHQRKRNGLPDGSTQTGSSKPRKRKPAELPRRLPSRFRQNFSRPLHDEHIPENQPIENANWSSTSRSTSVESLPSLSRCSSESSSLVSSDDDESQAQTPPPLQYPYDFSVYDFDSYPGPLNDHLPKSLFTLQDDSDFLHLNLTSVPHLHSSKGVFVAS